MSKSQEKEFTGRHMLMVMLGAFGVIITVNLTMAYNAIGTFPGLEVKNSYVASQNFDKNRASQQALGWTTDVRLDDGVLHLVFTDKQGQPVRAELLSVTLGRSTHVRDDQTPPFRWTGRDFTAPVDLDGGNWNIRLVAQAEDGTQFRQRMVFYVKG
ncbi:nitrogen fixation protein fixH [Dinoroseobacter shibae DFL 12 = DSM 16493]|jgi:nitrogen fixation protein FixH|uniref:Nitrogen fixation protein fixH n=1 Tax=Dinoroseobacter shibae (strain DSM 16493 / NCIMB 14021 / DFL 12) TaxID=398580 RepID=A8LQC6_DINSH|nr:FixH family protein [Dinoroseobacter shibae]ABV92412.1 nitrogen fixation protein fixH [Dinoroseobacter shibae DFL 12 = DSM 16493]URF47358.1 FixH family protein [Dinoroseobacter shibae]URF51669.1 FixH family protein [Dinoroseobacter shibae]